MTQIVEAVKAIKKGDGLYSTGVLTGKLFLDGFSCSYVGFNFNFNFFLLLLLLLLWLKPPLGKFWMIMNVKAKIVFLVSHVIMTCYFRGNQMLDFLFTGSCN